MFEPLGYFKSGGRAFNFGCAGLKPARDAAGGGDPFFNRHTINPSEKIRVPDGSAILAVGDALKSDILLHLDDIANATIFDLAQRSSGQFAALPTFASPQEFLRAQQAADMIGTKRGSRRGHWMFLSPTTFKTT
jgi:hypothetical protein